MSTTNNPSRPLGVDEEAFIRSLARVIHALPRVMDADLMREQGMPLVEYTTLMHLSEAPDSRLRMSELAGAVDMSFSGMTRIVTRLEARGLVRRVRCEQDGRGWNAVLTDAGLARLKEAWPSHLAASRRHVLDHFEGVDLAQLARVLRRVGT